MTFWTCQRSRLESSPWSDRISILLNGKKIAHLDPPLLKSQTKETTSTQIVKLMFGGSATQEMLKRNNSISDTPTLSLENIIVLCIIFVMSLVLFFSFGVEKGRRNMAKKAKKADVKICAKFLYRFYTVWAQE